MPELFVPDSQAPILPAVVAPPGRCCASAQSSHTARGAVTRVDRSTTSTGQLYEVGVQTCSEYVMPCGI